MSITETIPLPFDPPALCTPSDDQTALTASPGTVRVEQGDAFDLIPSLEHASVDMVITSPPYWGHRTYGQDHNWSILDEWLATGRTAEAAPGYDWYRNHGGALGLEPLPEWYTYHLAQILGLVA